MARHGSHLVFLVGLRAFGPLDCLALCQVTNVLASTIGTAAKRQRTFQNVTQYTVTAAKSL